MKPIVIVIVGLSGSGKSTLAQALQDRLGIPQLASYTTRPMRPGEKQGVGHIFTTAERYRKMPKKEILAHTVFGGEHYWTEKAQLYGNPVASYIVDETGANTLFDMMVKKKIAALFFKVWRLDNPTDPERLARDRDREDFKGSYDATISNITDVSGFERYGTQVVAETIIKQLAAGAVELDNQSLNCTIPTCLFKNPQ